MDILANLNNEQKLAVNHLNGPCLVMAGAGSGKTRVLTTRIANLINNGIKDYNILAITFTNKAAKEMRERVEVMFGSVNSFIGTFHSFGLKIIRENYKLCNLDRNFTIIDSDDVLSIIKKIIKNFNIDPKKVSPSFIRNKISFIKNEMLSNSDLEKYFNTEIDKICVRVYNEYQNILNKSNALDFDDLLVVPVTLFLNYPDILKHYQDHYPYILVDEYQDTNPVQYKMCKLLASTSRNIFVVGDMNQSIYAFRQADYKNILNFERDYPDAITIKLEENYRSTNNILNVANSVIKNNPSKLALNLWSSHGDGAKVKYIRGYDEHHEVKLVIEEIKRLLNNSYNKKDIAILYRTNGQSRVIEEEFLKANISYKVIGSYYFYNRKEIKDLIAYLRLINNLNDNISLRRIINVPKRGIGDTSINKLESLANTNNTSMFECLSTPKELEFKSIIESLIEDEKNMNLTDLIDSILQKSGILDELNSNMTLEQELRIENLNEFKSITASYLERSTSSNLSDFLDEISLISDMNQHNSDGDNVTLMTVHSAKGLEFKVVFLVGMEEGIFPHMNSFNEQDGIEEERRLCYVGITRAKEFLYILNAKARMLYGERKTNPVSRFIDEIDDSLLDKVNASKEEKVLEASSFYQEGLNDDIKMGDTIMHDTLGLGVVTKIDGNFIDIAFKTGKKTLVKNHNSIKKM